MPRWPVNLLLKLFGEPQIAIGGGAATAEAFLPAPSDAAVIQIRRPSGHARPAARRSTRRPASRRRLPS